MPGRLRVRTCGFADTLGNILIDFLTAAERAARCSAACNHLVCVAAQRAYLGFQSYLLCFSAKPRPAVWPRRRISTVLG